MVTNIETSIIRFKFLNLLPSLWSHKGPILGSYFDNKKELIYTWGQDGRVVAWNDWRGTILKII